MIDQNFYGATILEKEDLADGLIRILVSMCGSEVEYHVTQEELANANLTQNNE